MDSIQRLLKVRLPNVTNVINKRLRYITLTLTLSKLRCMTYNNIILGILFYQTF